MGRVVNRSRQFGMREQGRAERDDRAVGRSDFVRQPLETVTARYERIAPLVPLRGVDGRARPGVPATGGKAAPA